MKTGGVVDALDVACCRTIAGSGLKPFHQVKNQLLKCRKKNTESRNVLEISASFNCCAVDLVTPLSICLQSSAISRLKAV